MKTALLCLLGYVTLAGVAWFGLGSLNLPRLRRLVAEGATTEAVITLPECENHSSVRYEFAADGRSVVARGLSPETIPCRRIKVGDRFPVWYVPADPAVSTLREPQSALEKERASVCAAATVMPAIAIVVALGQSRLRARK
jgi:hypothetical protein